MRDFQPAIHSWSLQENTTEGEPVDFSKELLPRPIGRNFSNCQYLSPFLLNPVKGTPNFVHFFSTNFQYIFLQFYFQVSLRKAGSKSSTYLLPQCMVGFVAVLGRIHCPSEMYLEQLFGSLFLHPLCAQPAGQECQRSVSYLVSDARSCHSDIHSTFTPKMEFVETIGNPCSQLVSPQPQKGKTSGTLGVTLLRKALTLMAL